MSDEQFKRGFKKENENVKKKISVILSPKNMSTLKEGNFNKSKLIDHLLTEHFKQEDLKK